MIGSRYCSALRAGINAPGNGGGLHNMWVQASMSTMRGTRDVGRSFALLIGTSNLQLSPINAWPLSVPASHRSKYSTFYKDTYNYGAPGLFANQRG